MYKSSSCLISQKCKYEKESEFPELNNATDAFGSKSLQPKVLQACCCIKEKGSSNVSLYKFKQRKSKVNILHIINCINFKIK